jgi:hypothetical protein
VPQRAPGRPFGLVRATIEHRFHFDDGRLIRRVRTPSPGMAGNRPDADPELPALLRDAERFAACAAASANPARVHRAGALMEGLTRATSMHTLRGIRRK